MARFEYGKTEKKAAQGANWLSRAATGAFVLVVCALLALMFCQTRAPTPVPEKVKKPRRSARMQEAAKPVADTQKETPPAVAAPQPPKVQLTREEREEMIAKRIEENPPDMVAPSNRVFATGAEQVMSWIFMCRLGDPPPLLPKLSTRDLVHIDKILDAPNPVLEGDSERARDAKETVEMAKKELKEFLAKGGDPEEFLEYYHGQLRQAHAEWQEAYRKTLEVARETPEIANDYVDEVNKLLAERGIKPVVLPPKLKERYGIE